jgi:hypothetical protein
MGRPRITVEPRKGVKPSDVVAWLVRQRVKVLNVAGNRESRSPGIGGQVERFLGEVFRLLASFET